MSTCEATATLLKMWKKNKQKVPSDVDKIYGTYTKL